jgi:hypothetical protein
MSLCIVQAIAALFLIYMCVLYKYWTVLCGQQVGNYLELNTFLFVWGGGGPGPAVILQPPDHGPAVIPQPQI